MEDTVEAEVVEEHGQEVAVSIARPVITPDEAQVMVTELRQLISKILVKDKHYMSIKGRDVLLKAGAEELGKFFGLSTAYTDLATETDEGVFKASVKCSVSNAAGRVLAESYGFYGADEHRGKAPANTIVKMAQKRAYVGAILTATGTSELFTQDITEDETTPAAKHLVEDRLASDDERLLLAGLYARKHPGGATLDDAMKWIGSYKAKGDSRLWVAVQVLGLMLKPDPLNIPQMKEDLSRLGPEPELPVNDPATMSADGDPSGYGDPPIDGQTSIEDADGQDVPF